ncbi:hypothetical protein MW695_07270 [Alkalihalobacillus sp. APA_J-10(15)]|nr:hypothetical protein [Halalkalibacter sp. APA_J-10(15)]MCK0471178.1 hypothetical protein [Halalkalibacter sp. APA_J-10(15)]
MSDHSGRRSPVAGTGHPEWTQCFSPCRQMGGASGYGDPRSSWTASGLV